MTTRSTHAPIACTGRPKRPTSLLARLLTFLSINRERQRLGSLDEHLLRDIGVSREDADREAHRTSWDAPERWLR